MITIEKAQQEAERAIAQLQQTALNLRQRGISIDEIVKITGLSAEIIAKL